MDKLKELLGEELFAQVMEKMGTGRTVAIVAGDGADGSWVPKAKFDAEHEEVKTLKATLSERDTQLTTLKADAETSEALKATITELENKNKAEAEEHAAALKQQKVAFGIQTALKDAGATLVEAALPFIDVSKVTLGEDGKLYGLDEQLTALKAEGAKTAMLFTTPDTSIEGRQSAAAGGSPAGGKPWNKMTLTEQSELYRTDPKSAEALKAQAE